MNTLMSEKLSSSIIALHNEINITLSEAIHVLEDEGYKIKDVIDKPDLHTYLTKIRMTVLHQKNNLKELKDLMRTVLQKEEKEGQSIN